MSYISIFGKGEYSVLELKGRNPIQRMAYSDLLKCKEWHIKRKEIIERDKYTCQKCNKEGFMGYTMKMIYRKDGTSDVIFVPANLDVVQTFSLEQTIYGKIEMPKMEAIIEEVLAPIFLQVHHKVYYIKPPVLGKMFEFIYPWDYNDEDLITVCSSCHELIHESENIPKIIKSSLENLDLTPCGRCNGIGFFPQYHYVQNGICFECEGVMYIEMINKGNNIEDSDLPF